MRRLSIRLALFAIFCKIAAAHERPVHEEMAIAAGISSEGLAAFLELTIGPPSGPSPYLLSPGLSLSPGITLPDGDVLRDECGAPASPYGPIQWLRWGSKFEDRALNIRGCDHFYNPLTRGPLTDPDEGAVLAGPKADSFSWATVPGLTEARFLSLPLLGAQNHMKWSDARAYEYGSLTNVSVSDRNASLALTLYGITATFSTSFRTCPRLSIRGMTPTG